MKLFAALSLACVFLFAVVGLVHGDATTPLSGLAFAPGETQQADAYHRSTPIGTERVEALQDYLSSHASLVSHAKIRLAQAADTPAGNKPAKKKAPAGKPTAKNAPPAKAPAAKNASAGNKPAPTSAPATNAAADVKIPTAQEKAKQGQTDDLLVPIDPERRDSDGASEQSSASSADDEHLKLFVENKYPSAATCGVCHPKHYKEWSVSQHAYAQLSPIYLSLNNRINQLSNGSNGDFCLRCHSPVGANLGESPFMSNLDRHPTSREGITCVACHRINQAYNKASGRLALVEGGLTDPVFGPEGNEGVKDVLSKPDKYRVVTDEKEPGRKIHAEAQVFDSIKTPVFCGTCHDVTLFNGFRLEEAYSEYRVSPAAAKGVTCQDCHMGKIQGKVSGYDTGPAAVVGNVPTKDRKLTSHLFSGPDFSVVHPGIFPHNEKAAAFKTMREWLQFKHKEGWGTDAFEDSVPNGYKFPKAWESIDDRYEAREILNDQYKLLDFARLKRLEVLRNGFILGDIVTTKANSSGLAFKVQVRNGTDGHNVPTGFTGERLIWLEVTVRDRDGAIVFKSGDRDPNGDLRDGHSSYVHAGKLKRDSQLFSLQSIFVTQNGRGGEIEHVIPIPFPFTALPRVLPSTTSLVFTGEPATERNHKKGIEPNGDRWASYRVPRRALTGKGPYVATVRLLAQPVPVNLIIASQKVGFDYGMTPRQLGDELIQGTQTLWQRKLTLGQTSRGQASRGQAPSGPAPSGPAPSALGPSGSAPSGPAPSRQAPSGQAPSGQAPSQSRGEVLPWHEGAVRPGAAQSGAAQSGAAPRGFAQRGFADE